MDNKTATHYEVLGVETGATQNDIKLAYRELSKQHHPDKPNGNEEKFKAIAEAYRILSDVLLREEYDRTGNNLTAKSIDALAIEQLVVSFTQLIQQKVPKGGNPFEVLEEYLEKNLGEATVKRGKLEAEIKRLKEIKSRIHYKKRKGDCYFSNRLKQLIKDIEGHKVKTIRDLKVLQRAKVLLKNHSYSVDPQDYLAQPMMQIQGSVFVRGFTTAAQYGE